jgi:polar amino acid transport system substrate-binding protein
VPAALKAKGVVTFVTDNTYAPVAFTDDSGKTIGLNPDLSVALAKKMGLTAKIEIGDFNGILAGINSGRYDATMGPLSVTKARLAEVNMVGFLHGGTSVVVKSGNPQDIKSDLDLCGKTIAVQTGTTQAMIVLPSFEQKCSDAGQEKPEALQLPDQSSANQAVATGRADATAADSAVTGYIARIQPEAFTAVDSILVSPTLAGSVTSKDDNGLSQAFQAGFQSLMDDGTYDKIMDSWDFKAGKIDKSVLNPADAQ